MFPERVRSIRALAAGVGAALLTVGAVRLGAQAASVVAVSAMVIDECRVTSGRLDFGRYNPVGAQASQGLDADASFEVQCAPGSVARVSLGLGLAPLGSQRRMSAAGGREYLNYELYQDPGRSAAWGPGNPVTLDSFGPAPKQVHVYGRVPGGQDAAIGTYADSVVITVTF